MFFYRFYLKIDFNFDFMIDLHSIPYYRILILISCPFVYCFLLAIFWILYKFRSKQDVFENFLITTSITFFYFQSSIINALADLLSCTKIENDFYLTNYLLENCGENSKYEHWRNILIIPTFCFFFCNFDNYRLYLQKHGNSLFS